MSFRRFFTLTVASLTVAASAAMATLSAEQLHARLQAEGDKPLVVDVRETDEFEAGHIAGALLAPLGGVEKDLASISKTREIVLVCRSGRRSAVAYRRLSEIGFTNLKNMEGGMIAWEKAGYPTVK